MKITLNITQGNIDRGVACNCRNCPAALAMVEAMNKAGVPGYAEVRAGGQACFFVGAKLMRFKPSEELEEFTDAFDEALGVDPISIELEEAV